MCVSVCEHVFNREIIEGYMFSETCVMDARWGCPHGYLQQMFMSRNEMENQYSGNVISRAVLCLLQFEVHEV